MGAFLAVPVAATVAVVFRYIQDMLRIHAGEVRADDLRFSTDVGRALAEAEELESAKAREDLSTQSGWAAPHITEKLLDDSPAPTSLRLPFDKLPLRRNKDNKDNKDQGVSGARNNRIERLVQRLPRRDRTEPQPNIGE